MTDRSERTDERSREAWSGAQGRATLGGRTDDPTGGSSGDPVGTAEEPAPPAVDLANAVEVVDPGRAPEGQICYVYPANASDHELENQWLAAPARLLVELSDLR